MRVKKLVAFLVVLAAVVGLGLGIGLSQQSEAGSQPLVCGGYTVHLNPDGVSVRAVMPPKGGAVIAIADVIIGTGAGDTLLGSGAAELMLGGGGNDFISAFGGDDVVCGGGGCDSVLGGAGNDTIEGNGGDDEQGCPVGSGGFIEGGGLFGQSGNDRLNGGGGDDRLSGDGGDDTLNGDGGFDFCIGGTGNDTVNNCEAPGPTPSPTPEPPRVFMIPPGPETSRDGNWTFTS